jgi:APA family basic amino acid/polyamine antiporter
MAVRIQMAGNRNELLRGLNLTDATILVIGTVIGTGVFLKSAVMAQQLGSAGLVLAAWLAAGLLSFAGALAYAELGAMFPHAGGEYVYLRTAYGDAPAFLYGWMQFAVASPGGIAALGMGFAIFLSALIPMGGAWIERPVRLLGSDFVWQFGPAQVLAVGAILLFSFLNCLGVALGSRVQFVLTLAKVAGIAIIAGGVFFFSRAASWANLATAPAEAGTGGGVQAFGAAMLAALWAYNGWYTLPAMAGEVIEPQRNVPRGLLAGMLVVLVAYLAANAAYFYALPANEVAAANSTAHPGALPVAAKAAETFLGPVGAGFVSLIFVISTLGALNGVIMAFARIPFAMARDGLFFPRIAELHPQRRVPVWSITIQGVWASVLALSGTFDQITTYVIFALWLFFGVTVSTVFTLRRKLPQVERPYRTLGYPVLPLVFVLVASWLVVNAVLTTPLESAIGLGLIGLGLPVYWFFRRIRQTAAPPNEEGVSETYSGVR